MPGRAAAVVVILLSISVVMGQIGPALDITKTVDQKVIYSGEEVNFTIFLNNTGDQTISAINLTDDLYGSVGSLIELDPQMNFTFIYNYTIYADVINNVTAEGLNATGYLVATGDSVLVDVIHPNLTLVKTAEPATTYAGENVTYSIVVMNMGDVNITSINITDDLFGLVEGPLDLSPGENLTSAYNWTVEGDTVNNASATGLDPLYNNVTANASAFVDVIHPNLTLIKTVSPGIIYSGENVTYTLLLLNTGDVNITSINLTDPAIELAAGPHELAPGENLTRVLNITVYDDLYNTASASGFDPIGGMIGTNSSAFVDVIHPELTLTKTVEPSTVPAKGNVTYTFLLENTGDVNLTAVNISDPDLSWVAGPFILVPGENVTLQVNATAYVTSTNNATAVGLDILGNPVLAWDTAHVTVVTTSDIRSIGYWKHQFSDKGRRHIDRSTLEDFLGLILDQSSIFGEIFPLSYENASSYLWLKKASMLDRSVQQCLACWLNWANGAVDLSELVDTDWDGEPDTTFGEAMAIVEDLIANGDGKDDYERAKDICDSINNSGDHDEEGEESGDGGPEESDGRGPPEDKGEPQGRGPPEDKDPPVKRGPPEDKGEPQGRGPPEDKGSKGKKS
jgi:uncharacterized repeat protein (TIGR01451 family)